MAHYTVYFTLYSCLGWIYETALCSLKEARAVNRGFLAGPYCPIYGTGAVLFLLIFGKETSVTLILTFGAVIACAIEYVTSYAMEKLFGARWWDYSSHPFNLNGRICLGAASVFGLGAVLLIKALHPSVSAAVAFLPEPLLIAISAACTVVFILDLFFTLRGFGGFGCGFADGGKLSRQEKRIIRAFPTLSLVSGKKLPERK